MSSIWSSLPTLTQIVDTTSIMSFGEAWLSGEVMTLWFTNQLAIQSWVYTGILAGLVMSFVGAAYVVRKMVHCGVGFTGIYVEGYAATYRNAENQWGNYLGLFEVIALALHAMWSLVVTVTALVLASNLWEQMEARELGVKTEGDGSGAGGVAVDDIVALKYFTLCIIGGIMAIVGGYGLGDVTDAQIAWFDHYADDTKTEGTDKTTGDADPNGTAAQFDIIYHYVTFIAGYIVFTAITVGGYIYAAEMMNLTNWGDSFECDFQSIDASVKAEFVTIMQGVSSLEKCYEELPKALKKFDVNNNGILDRCEDAIGLNTLGFSEEYALKYSHNLAVSAAKARCDQVFNPLFGQ